MKNRSKFYKVGLFFILCTLIIAVPYKESKVNAASANFYDIPSSYWASQEIRYLSSRSIINGYQNSKGSYFAPERTVTRAQAAKMIVLAKGANEARVSERVFSDVSKGHWAAGWIQKAVQLNIFDGKKDGTFAPDEPLKRSQMAKIIVKAFGLTVENNEVEPFTDVYINHEFRPYVSTLYQLGITTGSGNQFNPGKHIKRSEFATFLTRTLNTSYRKIPSTDKQPNLETKPTQSAKTATVTADILNVRSGSSTNSRVIGQLSFGNIVNITFVDGGWARILYNDQVGYVSASYLNIGSTTSEAINLENQVIVLDAGHGGKDPGAIGHGMYEKDIVFEVVNLLEQKMKDTGAKVILTRSSDVYPSLNDRVKIANQNGADIFVSVHANAGPSTAHGTETYYDSSKNPQSAEGKKLAAEIQQQIVSLLGTRDRGVKDAEFLVITQTKMPSVLVELGFISNSDDAKKLAEQRSLFADAIYNGILAYYEKR
ncbi:N-acetylmuramoyl-L-alanine amidase [Bacillus dakarensis]|uniref:N-acetylmuramoyl-L-alanine amidase n=1 Tax=Robertmurraya dakarensis TaxID=1926278 RepID=UPI0009820F3C|nr:N-acetylmuramoyl-L-alanine amidase [Bacillus dakarensis]